MTKFWEKKVVLLEREVTEGTDPTPVVGTNALRVLNYQPTFMDAEGKVRNLEKAYFGADPTAMARFQRGASWEMEMHGGGAAATVPMWMEPLRVAGFAAPVVVASTSVTLNPTSVVDSATHWGYLDNLLLKTIGGRATMGYRIEDDEFPVFTYNFLGRAPTTLAEEATPGTPVITGVVDPLIASSENSTFLLDGYAAPLRRMTMAMNADLQYRSLIGPQDRVIYRDRSMSGEIVIELPDLTAKDYFSKIRPGTTMASSFVHGAVAGNIVTVTHPKLQITGNVTLSEEQGAVMATLPVTALPDTGNDEVRFVTT